MIVVVAEQLEILRRIAERGQHAAWGLGHDGDRSQFVDIFQHLLNEIEVTKKHYGSYQQKESS